MVGVGTAIADDPLLTVRQMAVEQQALRVVLDGQLRLPLESRLVATAGAHPTLVIAGAQAPAMQKADLQTRGVEVELVGGWSPTAGSTFARRCGCSRSAA